MKNATRCTVLISFIEGQSALAVYIKWSSTKTVERLFTYDRDIVCLPKSFVGEEGLIKIPRQHAVCDFLAANHLTGKIRLTSSMSEEDIMNEIRSVFDNPMKHNHCFRFKILQR